MPKHKEKFFPGARTGLTAEGRRASGFFLFRPLKAGDVSPEIVNPYGRQFRGLYPGNPPDSSGPFHHSSTGVASPAKGGQGIPAKGIKGFTLVEILIAVSIILVLAVLVIPNVLRSRINSNEVATVSNLSSLGKAIQQYYMTNNYKYPQTLEALVTPNSDPPYITRDFIDSAKSGYLYVYVYEDEDDFRLLVSPKTPGKTGVRYFYLDETGIIRGKEGGPASENDSPVQ